MKKITFCNYKYIISKYFSILKNVKEIKRIFSEKIKERKAKILCFKSKSKMNILRKCFIIMSERKKNRMANVHKMEKIKENSKKFTWKMFMTFWKDALSNKRKKMQSALRINDYFLKKTAQIKTENFTDLKIHSNSFQNFKLLSKPEVEIRLEIKYQNLEKLIKKFEVLKTQIKEKVEANKNHDSSSENDMNLLKSLIKSQMKEIEHLKSFL